jgi:hypothetical protein
LTTGDLYNTELFLGNDNLYVKLANTGNVVINSYDNAGNSAQWTFGTDGDLTFPTGNLVITPVDAAFGNSAVIASEDHNLITFSTGANGGVSSLWVEDIGNVGTSNIAAVYANPTPGSKIVRIAVGQNGGGGGGPNLWNFDNIGTLTLPGGSRLRPLGANLDIFAGTGSYVNLITDDESSRVGVSGAGGYIVTAGGTWQFDTTGNLSAPGNISAVGNITGGNLSVTGNLSGNTAGFAIGYRDIPQVSFTGNATIAATDAGKHYYSTQSSNYILTIANNASQSFQVGAAITVVNQGTGTITVAQGSGVTLYLASNATSGNRSVSTFGMATIMKVATDTWFINGTGVS